MEDNQQTDQDNQITLEQVQEELNQTLNNWKRTAADFENYKKRKEAENKELLEFAKEVTVAKLLPIIDTLEQALRHLPEYTPTTPSRQGGAPLLEKEGNAPQLSVERGGASPPDKGESLPKAGEGVGESDFAKKYQNWQTGINGILSQLDKTLEELGVKKIEAIGKKFDPYKHEAVRQVDGEEDDVVVDELQSGFELNGKVIRPSQVIISKRK